MRDKRVKERNKSNKEQSTGHVESRTSLKSCADIWMIFKIIIIIVITLLKIIIKPLCLKYEGVICWGRRAHILLKLLSGSAVHFAHLFHNSPHQSVSWIKSSHVLCWVCIGLRFNLSSWKNKHGRRGGGATAYICSINNHYVMHSYTNH